MRLDEIRKKMRDGTFLETKPKCVEENAKKSLFREALEDMEGEARREDEERERENEEKHGEESGETTEKKEEDKKESESASTEKKKVLSTKRMECHVGTSRKVYEIIHYLEPDGTHEVWAYWGRIASKLRSQIKFQGRAESHAKNIIRELSNKKIKKGYRSVSTGGA